MVFTPFGIVISVNAVQPQKASSPIDVIPLGNTMLFRLVQLLNAEAPIAFMLFGNFTLTKLLHPENLPLFISVIKALISMLLSVVELLNISFTDVTG